MTESLSVNENSPKIPGLSDDITIKGILATSMLDKKLSKGVTSTIYLAETGSGEDREEFVIKVANKDPKAIEAIQREYEFLMNYGDGHIPEHIESVDLEFQGINVHARYVQPRLQNMGEEMIKNGAIALELVKGEELAYFGTDTERAAATLAYFQLENRTAQDVGAHLDSHYPTDVLVIKNSDSDLEVVRLDPIIDYSAKVDENNSWSRLYAEIIEVELTYAKEPRYVIADRYDLVTALIRGQVAQWKQDGFTPVNVERFYKLFSDLTRIVWDQDVTDIMRAKFSSGKGIFKHVAENEIEDTIKRLQTESKQVRPQNPNL